MASPRLQIAHLDNDSLEKLKTLEEEFGTTILALEPKYPAADLTAEQLRKLQQLESELGVVLLAYRRD